MSKINIYLLFNNETEKVFNFYRSVFGGEFSSLQKFKDVPARDREQGQFKESESEKIINVSLPIGKDSVLMASDSPESMGKVKFGNNFSISFEAESKKEAEKIFNGLVIGGKTKMPMIDTFWGAYYGMIEDKFGINWMISYTYPKKNKIKQ